MKAYNEYMDNISVSEALHHELLAYATDGRSPRRLIMIRRYATAFACLAVIMLGMLTVPRLMQNNVAPTQRATRLANTRLFSISLTARFLPISLFQVTLGESLRQMNLKRSFPAWRIHTLLRLLQISGAMRLARHCLI